MKIYLEGSDLEQYTTIITCFRLHVMHELHQEELPPQFQVEEEEVGYLGVKWLGSRRKTKILYRYHSTSFSPQYWQPVITLVPIRNAIHAICAYQTSRAARIAGDGNLLDCTNLVCEQLKSWLMSLASRDMSDGKAIQKEITCYTNYLKALDQAQVFPVGINHERTMKSTLVEVSDFLHKASAEVGSMMSRKSLRDVMTQVRKSTTNAVDTLIQYLFYSLRSHKTPAAISTLDIKQGLRLDLQEAKQTRSFRLLQLLVESPAVQAVNQEVDQPSKELLPQEVKCVFQETSDKPLLHLKKNWHSSGVFDSDSARRTNTLNQAIGGHLIPDRHGLRRWWDNIHSGIRGHFQADTDSSQRTLTHFVKLHALVEKLALFCLICRDLEELVDFFGSKMWAEFGGQILHNFQEGYRRLCNDIRSSVQDIQDVTSQHYRSLTQKGISRKPWLQNYNTADRLKTTLFAELDCATDNVHQMNGIVSTLRSPKKETQIRQKLTGVVSALNQFGSFFKVNPIELPSHYSLSLQPDNTARVLDSI